MIGCHYFPSELIINCLHNVITENYQGERCEAGEILPWGEVCSPPPVESLHPSNDARTPPQVMMQDAKEGVLSQDKVDLTTNILE